MQSFEKKSVWQFIDGVFVINLDQRSDRWEQFQRNAQGLIPPEKLHRLSACYGRNLPGFGERPWFRATKGKRDATWAGRAGCTLSHRSALQEAQKLGWRVTLVFEDDVVFENDFNVVLEALALALHDANWQVCYLGCTEPLSPARKITGLSPSFSLHQIQGATTTHAYLVRESARDWLVANLPSESQVWSWVSAHRAIDRWYQRQLALHFPVLCVSPNVVKQISGYSDIVERDADHSAESNLPEKLTSHSRVVYASAAALRCLYVRLSYWVDIVRGSLRRLKGF